jgi:hypothetical protein
MSTTLPNTVTVSTAAELMTALANAKGGETILLATGNYGELNLYDQRETFANFASEVTIKSADPNDLASFARVSLRGVENLTFDTIKFDYDAAPGTIESDKPFMIRESDSIIVRNSIFEGDMAEGVSDILNGHPTGHGLTVTGSSNITIENNSFYDFLRGAVFDKASRSPGTRFMTFEATGSTSYPSPMPSSKVTTFTTSMALPIFTGI